jgi:hypothetical protein
MEAMRESMEAEENDTKPVIVDAVAGFYFFEAAYIQGQIYMIKIYDGEVFTIDMQSYNWMAILQDC